MEVLEYVFLEILACKIHYTVFHSKNNLTMPTLLSLTALFCNLNKFFMLEDDPQN